MKTPIDDFIFKIKQLKEERRHNMGLVTAYILTLEHKELPIIFVENCVPKFHEKDHEALQHATFKLFSSCMECSVNSKTSQPLIIDDQYKGVIYFPEWNNGQWFITDIYGNIVYNKESLNIKPVMETPNVYSDKN